MPLWKSSQPSGIIGPIETVCSNVGESGFALFTCSIIFLSPQATIILISAALFL